MADRQKDKKMSSDRGFLSRWSERKTLAAQGEVLPDEAELLDQNVEAENRSDSDEDADLSDEELLKKYNLPDPETINDESGLDRFMSGEMPERLRQIALRRLWRLNPLFGVVDDMVEYGEDYTDAATVIEGMQTAYTAGKGYLTKTAEDLEDKDDLEQTEDVELEAKDSRDEDSAAKIDGDEEAESQRPSETASNGTAEKVADPVDLGDEAEQISDSVTIVSGVPDDLIIREIRDAAQAQKDAVTKTDEIVKNTLETEKEINKDSVLQSKIMEKPRRMVFHKKEIDP